MKTYRAGIIGIGDIGFKHPYVTHPEVYKMTSNCELVAVCDISQDRLDRFREVWEVEKTFADYREMLEDADLDIVSICTPHNLHCEMTLKAAEEGVHVLCEKPIAMNLDEADAMIEACDRAGVKLAVISPRRFLKVFRELKSIVAQKPIKIGERFSEENLTIKRPGIGFPPSYIERIIGKKAKIYILKDSILTNELIDI